MPTTYNGIGTHYYGRKNVEQRSAACPHCGALVELSAYDTRLWFVIFFIPIIPLGRMRITDHCPHCTRHFCMDLDKWETAKQLEISGALEKYRADPSVESAIGVHQQLIQFHQTAQAVEFQAEMSRKFSHNAKVQVHLGAAAEHLGRLDEAAMFYARALELRADLPEARVGVARAHIRVGRLDEARTLLNFLEKPGAVQLYSLVPLEELAHRYQAAARHMEALELFGKLLEALPHIARHAGFRRAVKQSEKALGRRESILPKEKFSWRRFFSLERNSVAPVAGPRLTWGTLLGVGCVVGVIVLGLVIGNEYTRRHRTLYVVNGFKQPATIEIPGVGVVRTTRGVQEFTLAEGRYHATISGPVRHELDFVVQADYFSRWSDRPAWVINVGGSAVLVLEEVVYSRNPRPGSTSVRFGEVFMHYPRVTHPFTELPATVQVESNEERVLTKLDLFKGNPVDVFYFLQRQSQSPRALDLAEQQLRLLSDNVPLLNDYVSEVRGSNQMDRVEKFLHGGLTNRPVQIEWHRYYQSIRPSRQHNAGLQAEYDALLQAEPTNSALIYLRGRLIEDRQVSRLWFERARAADPQNPWPSYALGWERIAVGDWAGARPFLARVVELRPEEPAFKGLFSEVRRALGENAELERELRGKLAQNAFDAMAVMTLCEVLVAQGKNTEAGQVANNFNMTVGRQKPNFAHELGNLVSYHALYSSGDFAGLEKLALTDRTLAGSNALFQARMELGRPAEALQVRRINENDEAPFDCLAISLGWRLAGDLGQAATWQKQAIRLLEAGTSDERRAAALLAREQSPTAEERGNILLPTNAKSIWLAALAQQFPAQRAELGAAARQMNVEWKYPHYLVERITR